MQYPPRPPRPRAVAKAEARSVKRDLLIFVALTLLFIAGLFWLGSIAYGGELPRSSRQALERRVWTADPEDFPTIEHEAVREIQTNPGSAFGHYLVGHLYVRMFTNDPSDLSILKRASELGQQAIDLDPREDYGYVVIAEILDLMGQPANGVKILDMAGAAHVAQSWRTYFTKARLQSDNSGSQTVLALLKQALNQKDAQRDVIAPYVVAVLQSEANGKELLSQVRKWNDEYPDEIFKQAIAVALVDDGKAAEAHQIYETIYAADPTNREAMINDGIILYRNLGKPENARSLLTRALDAQGATPAKPVTAMASAHLGVLDLRAGKVEDAQVDFTRALEATDDQLSMLDFVSRAYQDDKKYGDLASLIGHLNQEMPGNSVFYALLGETLSENLKDNAKAIKAYDAAITLEPDRSDYYNGMGLVYYRMNDLPKALTAFSAATKIDPQDATAKYNEACALARLGRKEKALGSLKEAIVLDPRLQAQARNDSDFSGIKGLKQFEALVSDPALANDDGSKEKRDGEAGLAH